MLRDATVFLILVLIASMSPPALAGESFATLVADLYGHIDLAADGSVQDYSLSPSLPHDPALKRALDQRIRSWRFSPVAPGETPVTSRISVDIALQGLPTPGSKEMTINLARVEFYDPPMPDVSGKHGTSLRMPNYPDDVLGSGIGAQLDLLFKLDGDGHTVDSQIAGMDLLLPRVMGRAEAAHYAREFQKETLAVARHWNFPARYRGACEQPCLLMTRIRYVPCYCAVQGFWIGLQPVSAPVPVPEWASAPNPVSLVRLDGAHTSARRLLDATQAQGMLWRELDDQSTK